MANCAINQTCNNPLNIKFNPQNKWQGQTGEFRGFCVFKSESYGFRAAYKILCTYIKNDVNTIRKIIERWAPPTENDTEKYIEFICYETIMADSDLLFNESIHDYWTLIIILQAMAKMECGRYYDEQTINLYINYPEKFV